MRELKDSGLLPNGYAKKILEILLEKGIANEKWTVEKIYDVTKGRSLNSKIIDELLSMAEENKVTEQIRRAEKLMELENFNEE